MGFFDRFKKIVAVIFDKVAWVKSLNFNFWDTKELAILQENLIASYKSGNRTITPEQMAQLENNPWVNTAVQVAPGNLIIRQKCLIDLFKNTPANTSLIYDQIRKLTHKSDATLKIWAEGYSYWRYTRDILDVWIENFKDPDIITIVNNIDIGFYQTSYNRNGVFYPAPFGDLRDIPLTSDLQVAHEPQTETHSNIIMQRNGDILTYTILGRPIGLNTHIPKDDYSITIVNGIPQGFKFYEGYDKKYANTAEEIADTLHPKRIASI